MALNYNEMPKGVIPGMGDANKNDVGGADTAFNGSRGVKSGRVQPLAASAVMGMRPVDDGDEGQNEGLPGTTTGKMPTHYAIVKPTNAKEEGF